jgi:hypothetical protein
MSETNQLNQLRVASFDIGKKNFSFCIEDINTDLLKEIDFQPQFQTHNKNGTTTSCFQEILDQIYNTGEIILHKNIDLTYDTDKKKKLDNKVLSNLNVELDFYSSTFENTDIVVIEQQMSFGKKINLIAIKIAQHCASYFLIKYPHIKVIEFPSYYKTQILGAEKDVSKTKKGNLKYVSMTKPKRKKWAIQICKEIFENKEDYESLERLNSSKKKDDLADTFLQLQAFKYLYFVSKALKEID